MIKRFLVVGTEPWFGPLLSKHHVVLELCKRYEVLYQEPVYHMGNLLHLRFPREITYAAAYHHNQPKTLKRIKPWWLLKTERSSLIRYLAQQFLLLQIKLSRFKPDVIISFSPDYAFLANGWDVPFIYYCVDTYQNRANEPHTLAIADLIITATQKLYQDFIAYEEKLKYLPHGVSLDFFKIGSELTVPNDLAHIPRPIVGFVGAVNAHLDVPLLLSVATRMPNLSFVLVGPYAPDDFGGALPTGSLAALQAVSNIYLLGPKPASELGLYTSAFDVGMIPYDLDHYRIHFSYHKVLQYLVSGKPVVTTVAAPKGNVIPSFYVGSKPDDFITALELALAEYNEDKAIENRNFAAQHTWEKRVDQLLDWLNELDRDLENDNE